MGEGLTGPRARRILRDRERAGDGMAWRLALPHHGRCGEMRREGGRTWTSAWSRIADRSSTGWASPRAGSGRWWSRVTGCTWRAPPGTRRASPTRRSSTSAAPWSTRRRRCSCAPGWCSASRRRPGPTSSATSRGRWSSPPGTWRLPPERRFTTLLDRQVTTVGYEVIEDDHGHAPVLEAMSEIAGRLAVIIGSGLMLNEFGGKGLLVGGAPGIPPASLVILGAGTPRPRGGGGRPRHRRPRGRARPRRGRAATAAGAGRATTCRRWSRTAATSRKRWALPTCLVCAVAVHGERSPVLVTRTCSS